MADPFGKVLGFIKRHTLFERANGVVVAVSGGADSVALLDMLVRLREMGASTPLNLHVAHLNHLLRFRESDEDAKFVRELSARLNLPSTIASADIPGAAAKAGRGVEEVAREIRYNFLLDVARENSCELIATGHTMSDQAETFLMRLARGAGPKGLAAMKPVVAAHDFRSAADQDHGRPPWSSSPILHPLLIRPLLAITREEVEEYCRARGLEFRTDSSNLSGDYTRNRVRSEVLPSLGSINPRVVENIARAAEILASDQEALDRLAASFVDAAALAETGAAGRRGGAYRVSAFLGQPEGLRRHMIIELLEGGRTLSAEASGEITSTHVKAVERLLADRMSGRRVELPGRLEVWREFDSLVIKSRDRALDQEPYAFELAGSTGEIEAGGLRLSMLRGRTGAALKEALGEARILRTGARRDWMMVVLDDEALPEMLVVRPRRSGERALVCGGGKIKKLKKLMIDHRIPTSRRSVWPVVTTPDGEYVWSPGLPPAQMYAAHDETHDLAILRASGI